MEGRMPRWATLTETSTREEVLAAVEEYERDIAELPTYADDEIDWRGDPPGQRKGCYWSFDGMAVFCYGEIQPDPVRRAQDRAGEEDQSQGWGV